ncbi:Rho GTPase-activating protein 39 [Hypsibius exemplaris]|uniref:Rho GTPase-activating protein 39 n=1 Tax=Hypsibius exemplaris TaxID=2072580 RepID=A0A1W0WBQ2_HYPEX|nr:Rho GTPase-activating protein 39 [Hypsibius exemplaris]
MEWVEIIEPRTKKHMYANLITGACVTEEPVGQRVKKTDQNQWWELYDANTERSYYYNASNQVTVWHRPENIRPSDIIPLAKLQNLKQNTEVRDVGDENHTGGSGKSRKRDSGNGLGNGTSHIQTPSSVKKNQQQTPSFERANPGSVRKASSETQTTPQSSPKDVKRHPSHHHHGHKCTPRGADQIRNVVNIPRQASTGFQHQQRTPTSREPANYYDEGPDDVWSNTSGLLAAAAGSLNGTTTTRGLMVSSESGRTPSPRSGANHDVPMGSLRRGTSSSADHHQQRLYENSALAESENAFYTNGGMGVMESSPSTSFSRVAAPVAMPRRQHSFDYKSSFENGGDASLPFRSSGRMKENYHQCPGTMMMPSGIRSVDSTPRVQRRNNSDAPLPQINEGPANGGAGTPMRKRRAVPKTNGNLSAASPQTSRLPTPSTPSSGVLQPNEGGSNSSHSHSSLESRRSLLGTKQPNNNNNSKAPPIPTSFVTSPSPFSPPHPRQNWSPVPVQRILSPQDSPVMSSFNPLFTKNSQLRRTISVDHHDLKSPTAVAGEGKPTIPYSPQLLRRNNTAKPAACRVSPNDLEEDRRIEEQLRAAKDAAKEFEMMGKSFSNHRPGNGTRSSERRKAIPPPVIQHHSDSGTDSEENDADVEDSDECEEDDDDDEDLDDISALDPSGQTRCGHLSPSQLRNHPNYYAIDRGIKSLHFDGTSSGGGGAGGLADSSEDELDSGGNRTFRSDRDKLPSLMDPRMQTASLRRKVNQPMNGLPKLLGLEKSQSVQTELALSAQQQQQYQHQHQQQTRPQSIIFPTQSEVSLTSTKSSSPVCRPYYPGLSTGSSTLTRDRSYASTEPEAAKSAAVKLNDHTKGIFRKKVSITSLLSWSKDAISKPLIMTADKLAKKESCSMFRLVQMYMSDRKPKENKSQDEIALELTRMAWQKASLRDELFIQICKQTTENRKPESLRRGWELMSICLAFFPPSSSFFGYLHTYIARFQTPSFDTLEVQVSHYASHSLKRLERMSQTGAKRGNKKPTVEEIQQARVQIFHPSMFGNSLEDVMQLQRERFPDRKLPWIQTVLSDEIRRLHGLRTEGIFRVPGDIDEVNMLKVRMDRWNSPDCQDPHVPSSLLKLWYRELYEPLIPARFYDLCIKNCNNPAAAVQIVEQLPPINRLVLTYLINFLQDFAQPENVVLTKMDAPNLAMVMAPNCLRCMSEDPQVIFENTRKEMSFMRTLMLGMETDWVKGIR